MARLFHFFLLATALLQNHLYVTTTTSAAFVVPREATRTNNVLLLPYSRRIRVHHSSSSLSLLRTRHRSIVTERHTIGTTTRLWETSSSSSSSGAGGATTITNTNDKIKLQRLQEELQRTKRQRVALQGQIQKLRDELETSQKQQRSVLEQELQQYEGAVRARRKLLDQTEVEILSKLDEAEAEMMLKVQSLETTAQQRRGDGSSSVTTNKSDGSSIIGSGGDEGESTVIDLGVVGPFLVVPLLAVLAIGRSMLESSEKKRRRRQQQQLEQERRESLLNDDSNPGLFGVGGTLPVVLAAGVATGLVLAFTMFTTTTTGPLSEPETIPPSTSVIDQQVVVSPADERRVSSSSSSSSLDAKVKEQVSSVPKDTPSKETLPSEQTSKMEGPAYGKESAVEKKTTTSTTVPEKIVPTTRVTSGDVAAKEHNAADESDAATEGTPSVPKTTSSTFSLPIFDAPDSKRDVGNAPARIGEEDKPRSDNVVTKETPKDTTEESDRSASGTSDSNTNAKKSFPSLGLPSPPAAESVKQEESTTTVTVDKERLGKPSPELSSSPSEQEKADEETSAVASSKKHFPGFTLPSFDTPSATDTILEGETMAVETPKAGTGPDKEAPRESTPSKKEKQEAAVETNEADTVPKTNLPSFGFDLPPLNAPPAADSANGEKTVPSNTSKEQQIPSKVHQALEESAPSKDPVGANKEEAAKETTPGRNNFRGFSLPSFDTPPGAVDNESVNGKESTREEDTKQGILSDKPTSEAPALPKEATADKHGEHSENPAVKAKEKESLSEEILSEGMLTRPTGDTPARPKGSTTSNQERTEKETTGALPNEQPREVGARKQIVDDTPTEEPKKAEYEADKAVSSAQVTGPNRKEEATEGSVAASPSNGPGGKLDPPKLSLPKNDVSPLNVPNLDVPKFDTRKLDLPTLQLPEFKLVGKTLDSFGPVLLGIGGAATVVSLGAIALRAGQDEVESTAQDNDVSSKTMLVETEPLVQADERASGQDLTAPKTEVNSEVDLSRMEPDLVGAEAKSRVPFDANAKFEFAQDAEIVPDDETGEGSPKESPIVEVQSAETEPVTVELEAPIDENERIESEPIVDLTRPVDDGEDESEPAEPDSAVPEPEQVEPTPEPERQLAAEAEPEETYRIEVKLELDAPFAADEQYELKLVEFSTQTTPSVEEKAGLTDVDQPGAPFVEAEQVFESVQRKLDIVEAEMVQTEPTPPAPSDRNKETTRPEPEMPSKAETSPTETKPETPTYDWPPRNGVGKRGEEPKSGGTSSVINEENEPWS